MIRLELLLEHGGTWIDSTMFCTGRKFERVMNLPFFTFREHEDKLELGSVFIVSDPGNPILAVTRDLMFEYFREHNFYTNYFMLNVFFEMAAEHYRSEYFKMPFLSLKPMLLLFSCISADEDYSEEKLKKFAELTDFHKLTYKTVTNKQMLPGKIIPSLIKLFGPL